MIQFFRKFRQKFLIKKQTNNYLKYAIGEIILVVIGILIALQINNWNTKRIEKEKEALYLKNLKRDFIEQLTTLENQITFEIHIKKIAFPIIDYYKKHQKFKIDSLFTSNIGSLTGRKTFVKSQSTFTELISSGNIDIISDANIKDEIIKYYQELERIELIINKNNNLFVDAVFIPEMFQLSEIQIINDFNITSFLYKDKKSEDFIDLNEKRLKEITELQLSKPENELMMINAINYRNMISLVHQNLLRNLKDRTHAMLKKMNQ